MAAKTVGIGHQNFEQLIQADCFYIDKTDFIREWWENGDAVTLITRPRRFGKTLNMSMLEYFFSTKYAGRGDLFEGFSIWQERAADGEQSAGKRALQKPAARGFKPKKQEGQQKKRQLPQKSPCQKARNSAGDIFFHIYLSAGTSISRSESGKAAHG